MFAKLIIANRGEIAVRVIRTARALGIRTVAVYSDADRGALHVEMADEAWRIGSAPAGLSYLDHGSILEAARRSGADALHPGYGFLSENPAFAQAVIDAGLIFVGPPPAAMRSMGMKDEARRIMAAAGIPVVPGYDGTDQAPAELAEATLRIGFPALIKPLAGGGGRGMRIVRSEADLVEQLGAAQREAHAAFGDGRVLIEKYLPSVRHIEVQVMADRHGNVLHLFERDCSLQRRHQKVIEEAPAPHLPSGMRAEMCAAAVRAARRVDYEGAGTVEFLAPLEEGALTGAFYFIEMNTRLQVEHPVTEAVTGLDLVALQFHVAAGEAIGFRQEDVRCVGHAIEARIYAEDPSQGFTPQTGTISGLDVPLDPGIRFDGGLRRGDPVTPFYDPMIGKLIAHGPSREAALLKLQEALSRTRLVGLVTNLAFLGDLLRSPDFAATAFDTGFIARILEPSPSPPSPPLLAVAGAVLVRLGRLAAASSTLPFAALRGFQLWGGNRSVTLLFGGELLHVDVVDAGETITISHRGEDISVTLLRSTAGEMWLARDTGVNRLLWQDDGAVITIGLAGERFIFCRQGEDEAASQGAGGRILVSPVPGRLAKFMVSEGETVRAGDAVAVVEAMKTEFTLRAEAGGSVHLLAREGDQVTRGDIVAEIVGNHG